MAELVDALASGASVRMDVEVRVLFWAPHTECVGFSRSRQSRCARRLRGGGRKPGPQSRPCAGSRLFLSTRTKISDFGLFACRLPPANPTCGFRFEVVPLTRTTHGVCGFFSLTTVSLRLTSPRGRPSGRTCGRRSGRLFQAFLFRAPFLRSRRSRTDRRLRAGGFPWLRSPAPHIPHMGVGVVGCGCCGVRVLRCGRLLCIGIACRNGGIQPLWSVFQPE